MSEAPTLVIGCGRIAGGFNRGPDDAMVLTHALAYKRCTRYRLVACVEPAKDVREAFMKKWSVPEGYSTLEDALAAGNYAVASVCTATGTHLDTLARLANANVAAIFAEKPLDGNAEGARRLGRRFAEKGVPVAVNFTRRFDSAMHTLRADMKAGKFGALQSLVGWYVRGIVNNGSHLIDLAIFLSGRAAKIAQVGGSARFDIEGDPTVSAVLDLEGVPLHLIPASGGRFEIELAFEQAIVSIEENGLKIRTRPVRPSSQFADAMLPSQGTWTETNYGEAMLSALEELSGWHPGVRLSSDIDSACEAIALAGEIRNRALEACG